MLRIFYIEYFSTFGGDFAPIVVRNAGLLCYVGVYESCVAKFLLVAMYFSKLIEN